MPTSKARHTSHSQKTGPQLKNNVLPLIFFFQLQFVKYCFLHKPLYSPLYFLNFPDYLQNYH